jgi:murein DD-endopeptidase MepM/ murein hydrolase activator NlpD
MSNFFGEISGQDIIDLQNTLAQQQGNAILEDAARNAPAKDAKDGANSNNPTDERDDDADGDKPKKDKEPEKPQGLVDLVFAGTAVLVSAAATFIAGGGSSSGSPSSPAGGQSGAGNGGNANVARKPEDDDNVDKPVGHDNDDPSKGLTSKELNDYKALQDKLRANKDLTPAEQERHAYLGKIRDIQLYSDAVSQDGPGGNGKRDGKKEIENARLKPREIQIKIVDNVIQPGDTIDQFKGKIQAKQKVESEIADRKAKVSNALDEVQKAFKPRDGQYDQGRNLTEPNPAIAQIANSIDKYMKSDSQTKAKMLDDARISVKSKFNEIQSELKNTQGKIDQIKPIAFALDMRSGKDKGEIEGEIKKLGLKDGNNKPIITLEDYHNYAGALMSQKSKLLTAETHERDVMNNQLKQIDRIDTALMNLDTKAKELANSAKSDIYKSRIADVNDFTKTLLSIKSVDNIDSTKVKLNDSIEQNRNRVNESTKLLNDNDALAKDFYSRPEAHIAPSPSNEALKAYGKYIEDEARKNVSVNDQIKLANLEKNPKLKDDPNYKHLLNEKGEVKTEYKERYDKMKEATKTYNDALIKMKEEVAARANAKTKDEITAVNKKYGDTLFKYNTMPIREFAGGQRMPLAEGSYMNSPYVRDNDPTDIHGAWDSQTGGVYADQNSIYDNTGLNGNNGNLPVQVVKKGVVLDKGTGTNTGNFIRILHENGTITTYMHLEEIPKIENGSKVGTGQVVAVSGKTGINRKTGNPYTPHLHFQINKAVINNGEVTVENTTIDPATIDWRPKKENGQVYFPD